MAETVRELAAALYARCIGGFDNEFEWANWKIKHAPEIDSLPIALRRAVILAHHNATHKLFSIQTTPRHGGIPFTEEQFRAKYFEKVGPPNARGCREWMGARHPAGYGHVGHHGKTRKATHVALELFDGIPVPSGTVVMHSCDNPPCVEPTHLRRGSYAENHADMDAKGRRVVARARGERHRAAKLTSAAVAEIRRRAANGESQTLIANEFSVDASTVNGIVHRRTWRHLP